MLYSRGGGIAGSSNGRTLGSGPSNLGSSPSPAACFGRCVIISTRTYNRKKVNVLFFCEGIV